MLCTATLGGQIIKIIYEKFTYWMVEQLGLFVMKIVLMYLYIIAKSPKIENIIL